MSNTTKQQVILFFLALLAGSLSGEAAEIQFKPQAEVRGSLVLLGDIALIREADEEHADALKRIELFPSPASGRVRTVRDVEIRQLLQLHGVAAAEHRFTGAESIRIAHAKEGPSPTASQVATKNEKLVVVAKQEIPAGSLLRPLDVELKVPDRPFANGTSATSTEMVVGMETPRSYAAGQAIDVRSLRKPILVKRGDAVAVIAKAAGVRVRTTAKALSDAALGELVPVEASNREKYSAVVTGLREAEIFASGSSVRDEKQPAEKQPAAKQE